MPKTFKCSACKGQHQRPVGSKCTVIQMNNLDSDEPLMDSAQSGSVRAGAQTSNNRDNDILHALEAVSSRLSAIEQRIECTEERLDASPARVGLQQLPGAASSSQRSDAWQQDRMQDTIMPSVNTLRSSQMIQRQVD